MKAGAKRMNALIKQKKIGEIKNETKNLGRAYFPLSIIKHAAPVWIGGVTFRGRNNSELERQCVLMQNKGRVL